MTLIFDPVLSFSKLNRKKVPSDHFNFHLKQLVIWNLVEKGENGKYKLTIKGKEFANRMDTEKKIYEKQAKIGVLICLTRIKKGKTEYLIQQRLKEPYFGFYGFITGKVSLGETVFETAEKELKEETNLSAKLELKSISHKMDYSNKKTLQEDKFFFVFKADKPKGRLKSKFKGGRNVWLDRKSIMKFKKIYKDVHKLLDIIEGKRITFFEKKYIEEGF